MRASWGANDASRLFLHDLVWQLEVKGDHVAMVPYRDMLLVTGSEDAEGLRRMASAAEPALQDSRAMTGIPVRLKGTAWEPFLPDPEHPAYLPLKNLHAQTVAREYDQQEQLLDAIHERQGEDTFVANMMVVQNETSGLMHTMAVWSKGAVSLLPRVDKVAFIDPAEPEDGPVSTTAGWDTVCEAAGHLMQTTVSYPARYRVSQFPDAELLASIARESAGL